MAFENLNYSTEDMDNDSIQDKIDAETITLSQLTKKNLSQLKVDILNSTSSLTMRNENGAYIGKVKDDEILTFLGETKKVSYEGVDKIFLKVESKGKTGWVSADYVKGDISKNTTLTPNLTKKSDSEEEKGINENMNKSKEKEEQKSIIKKGEEKGGNKIMKNKGEGEKKKTTVQTTTTQQYNNQNTRSIYERGDDSITITENQSITNLDEYIKSYPKISKKLKNNYEKYTLLSEVFLPIWKQAALQKAQGESLQWVGDWANDRKDIENNLNTINSIDLLKVYASGNTDNFNTQLKNLEKLITQTERFDSTGIIDSDDVKSIFEIINNGKGALQEKKYKILNLMRAGGGFESGNSSGVAEVLIGDILKDTKYDKLKKQITTQTSSIDVSKNKVPEKYTEVYFKTKKQLDNLALQGKIKTENINPALEYQLKQSIIMSEMKEYLHSKDLTKLKDNDPLKILGNIFAEGKGSDMFSDNFAEGFTEGAIFIATSVIPGMGLGMLGAKMALMVGNVAIKATKIANLAQKTGKLGTLGKGLQGATIIGSEGVGLHVGMMSYENILHATKGSDFLELGTSADWAKSIAFAGVFRGVNGLITKYGSECQIFSTLGKIGDDGVYTFNKASTRIALTGILDTTGVGVSGFAIDSLLSDDKTEYTWDHILQMAAMSIVARAVGGNRIESGIGGGIKKNKENTQSIENKIGLNKPNEKQSKLHKKINQKAKGEIDVKGNKIETIPKNKTINITIDNKRYTIKTNQNGKISIKEGNKNLTIREVQTFIEKNQVILREKLGMKAKTIDSDNVNSQTESKVKSSENTVNSEILNFSEDNNFKKIFLEKFTESNIVTIENGKSGTLQINKQKNGLFTINKPNKPKSKALSEKEMLLKINSQYKIDFIENFNLTEILKIGKGKDIDLLKKYGFPFTGKLKIREGGIVELNGKELDIKYVKKIFKIPRIRQELFKKVYKIDENKISNTITNSTEFITAIDKFLSKLPFHLDKFWKIPKNIVYNTNKSRLRSIPKAIYNETMVPYRVVRDLVNAKNLTLEQNLKNILLTNKDYTIKDGLKRWAAFGIVFPAVETFLVIDDKNDTPDEFYKEALSNIYLGTINSAIYEYITKQNRIAEKNNY